MELGGLRQTPTLPAGAAPSPSAHGQGFPRRGPGGGPLPSLLRPSLGVLANGPANGLGLLSLIAASFLHVGRFGRRRRAARPLLRSSAEFLGRQGRFWRSLDWRRWHWSAEMQRADTIVMPPTSSEGPQRRVSEEEASGQKPLKEEVREFEEFGVVLLRGAITEWVPFLKEAVEHQMEHPQVSAFVTGLRSFFSMDYVQAGLFLTNDSFFDFWKSSNVPALVAQLLRCEEVRLVVDQLNVNPHCPPFTDAGKFHTDVGVISAVARAEEVVRVWIPLERSAMREGVGTLEFRLKGGERRRFEEVEPGDLLMFTPTIPHRVLFPESEIYDEDRCVLIASLWGGAGGAAGASAASASAPTQSESETRSRSPMAVPEFPRLFPTLDKAELQAREERRHPRGGGGGAKDQSLSPITAHS
ncbi:unnamed protein product [Symbiodinium sp. CCMP2592]|nr:unnamed protein product [Symbiodinium sp. CCMP2592]